jgi:hypothetical protein
MDWLAKVLGANLPEALDAGVFMFQTTIVSEFEGQLTKRTVGDLPTAGPKDPVLAERLGSTRVLHYVAVIAKHSKSNFEVCLFFLNPERHDPPPRVWTIRLKGDRLRESNLSVEGGYPPDAPGPLFFRPSCGTGSWDGRIVK